MTTENQTEKSSLERTLELTVSAAQLQADIDVILKKRAKTAKAHGFRPGKVPMAMVREMFGAQAHMDALNVLIGKAYDDALTASKLNVAGAPEIAPKGEFKAGEDLTFVATVEVMPEVEVPVLADVELKRYSCDVTDVEVEKTLDIMRKQRATFEEEAEGVAANEKRVTINFCGKLDGVAFEGGTAEAFPFVLGAGQMLPEFEAAVNGMKVGEKKAFDMTFPADYVEHLAGKTVTFDVELTKVETAKLPEIDEAFAKTLGVDDVAKLREEIAANLKREVKARITQKTKDGVMNALNDVCKFDLPKALVADEEQVLAKGFAQNMKARGMDLKDNPFKPEMFKDQAERRVRLGLVVNALVEKAGLAPTAEEVQAHIDDIAASYTDPAEVKAYFAGDKRRMADAEAFVLENKITEWALNNAKTTDEVVDFEQLMGAQ